jgi:NADH-quinone oxidoreductase subunit C
MRFDEIVAILKAQVSEDKFINMNAEVLQPFVEIVAEALPAIARILYEHPELYFDYLACITGIDNGPEVGTMAVISNLNSIPFSHQLTLRVTVQRNSTEEELPVVPTVSHIWRTADWHEREIYDLLGIRFEGHPDMRRILLPEDWVGHPLRKDYEVQEYYHGIRVKYENRDDPGAIDA